MSSATRTDDRTRCAASSSTSAKRSRTKRPLRARGAETTALLAGLCSIAVGLAVYWLARDPAALALAPGWLDSGTPRAVPGGGQLPSLCHVYGFAMLAIAGLRPWPDRVAQVCAGAALVACALELAQARSIVGVEAWVSYAAAATFDPFDVAAIAAGAGLAYWHGARLWSSQVMGHAA